MIVYVFLIIWLGLSVNGLILEYKNQSAIGDVFLVSIAWFFIGSLIVLLLYSSVLIIRPCDIVKTETFETEIVSIRSQNSVGGSFLIGCGSIGTEQYYVYMKKLEDGSYKQSKLPVERCRVYENSNLEPRVEWDMVTRVLPNWISFGFDTIDYFMIQSGDYRIIVPENTVIQSFEIN